MLHFTIGRNRAALSLEDPSGFCIRARLLKTALQFSRRFFRIAVRIDVLQASKT
jgi:hypothetical protein